MLFFSFQFLYFLLCHLKMNHVYQQVEQQDQGKKKIHYGSNSGQMSSYDFQQFLGNAGIEWLEFKLQQKNKG